MKTALRLRSSLDRECSPAAANAYLTERLIADYDEEFAHPPADPTSAFVARTPKETRREQTHMWDCCGLLPLGGERRGEEHRPRARKDRAAIHH